MRERKLSKEREGSKAEIDGDTLVCMSAQEDAEYDFVMRQQTIGMNKKHPKEKECAIGYNRFIHCT